MIEKATIVCDNIEIKTKANRVEAHLENVEAEDLLETIKELPDLARLVDLVGSEKLLEKIYPHEMVNHLRLNGTFFEFIKKLTDKEMKEDLLPNTFRFLSLSETLDVLLDSYNEPNDYIIKRLKERVRRRRGSNWSRFCRWIKGEKNERDKRI